mmetsp:Transcript_7006/g.25841  ORF Transcript_7006/g.25841 Transcript_7006/m.25841 type:complete len:90 (-) Transcript_7006:660-929(-)
MEHLVCLSQDGAVIPRRIISERFVGRVGRLGMPLWCGGSGSAAFSSECWAETEPPTDKLVTSKVQGHHGLRFGAGETGDSLEDRRKRDG